MRKINGIDEVIEDVRDLRATGVRLSLFYNKEMNSIFVEENPSQGTVQQFESDGLLYCGDVEGGVPILKRDIYEIVKEAIYENRRK